MRRLRTLSEQECYTRCYGDRDGVKIVSLEPRRPRYSLDVSGEELRAMFEEKLETREPDAAPVAPAEAA